ncbi:MAG: acyl-CoA dehydrogenase [Thermoleophilia bacterium]|nr:acyl-CoA dehydrogenase [Thermoleophilia bacterium]
MKLALEPAEQLLQEDVRAFLATHAPDASEIPHALDDRMAFLREWQARCYEAGFVGRAWPAEFGGGGRPTSEQIVVDQELAAAGAPEFPSVVGLDVLGPAILAFGTDEQRARYVRPILAAEELWAQGFSEPEAGSDLASLRTTAVETDEGWVLNGQKTWISWGQFARWCGVLARTDPELPKHKGISLLVVDMASPGLEVRPMEQITGHAEFCELFLDDVVVPSENMLGGRGDGWKIAMHVVGHERGTAALPRQVMLRTWLDRLVADAAAAGVLADERAQDELARALIEIEVLRHHASRTMAAFLNGGAVGPESSGVKLLMAQAEQTLCATALDVLGDAGAGPFWHERYLYSRAASVYGGTQQIQRDIIANRILSLPAE